ncbi:MAG: hypothetical protein ACRCYE_14765 [Sarcina sp.]
MKREDLLKKFLDSKGIYAMNKEEISRYFNVSDSIQCLKMFHEKTMNNNNYSMGLINEAGKIRTEEKILLQRIKALQLEIDIDLVNIISFGEEHLNRVKDEEFLSLLDRCYKNSEIVLGKVHQNICLKENRVFIGDVSRIRFGMREDDIVKILKKVIKKIDEKKASNIVESLLDEMNFENISKEYIKSTLSFQLNMPKILGELYIRDIKDTTSIYEVVKNFNKTINF